MTDDNPPTDIVDGRIVVDRTADGHRQQACQTASGEVFTEYGIMDTHQNFPVRTFEWQGEFPPDCIDDDDWQAIDDQFDIDVDQLSDHTLATHAVEQYDVVPVVVVQRGLKNVREARRVADSMNEDHPYRRYRKALLSDPRGL